jgi:hypothetical protein
MKRTLSVFAGLLACLTGCSGPKVEDYRDGKPTMDIREYFNGDVEATGIFIDYKGKMDSYFHISMHGSWKGNEGKLFERFTYDNGRIDEREWTIHVTDDHQIIGTAHDIVGQAVGKQQGNAVNLQYVMRVATEGTTYDLSMDDWMYRVDQHQVINRITMHKFGVKVGEIIVTFHKK